MKCKHDPADAVRELIFPPLRGATVPVIRLMCRACGAWLSLGPSNDKPDAVRIEMQLAACLAEIPELWEPKDQEAAFSQAIYSSMLAAEAGR